MTRWPATTVLLASLLAATDLVVTELASPDDTMIVTNAGAAPRSAAAIRLPSGTQAPSPTAIAAWSNAILARPLYANDRRPAGDSGNGGSLPRLSGILINGPERRAILAVSGPVKAITGVAGAKIGSWTIAAIEPDRVVLLGLDGMHTLRPAYAPPAELAVASPTNGGAPISPLAFNAQPVAAPDRIGGSGTDASAAIVSR